MDVAAAESLVLNGLLLGVIVNEAKDYPDLLKRWREGSEEDRNALRVRWTVLFLVSLLLLAHLWSKKTG